MFSHALVIQITHYNYYDISPRSTRPMTKQMISWASEDVNLLFALYDKQLFAAQSSAVQHRAKQASEKRLNATRNSLVKMVVIHPTQIGNLIGKVLRL